ncbi:MAG TPA: hypothetical protein PKA28_07610 [Methylomusa anaerophila]|nr:hypothetical protein [Methylomusa anaerophila]HML88298.1 hypothetical protein [Methylomusa anaerophila]
MVFVKGLLIAEENELVETLLKILEQIESAKISGADTTQLHEELFNTLEQIRILRKTIGMKTVGNVQ